MKIKPKDGILLPGDAVDPLDAVPKRQLDAVSAGGGHTIQDEGVDLPAQLRLNFRGAGVTASNDSVAGTTQVDIPGADVYQARSEKAQANGYAPLDASSLIPEVHIPAVAITDTFPVVSEAEMLALTAQRGDVAIRSDINKSFVLRATPASTLANWSELRTPTDAVLSVDARTGAVDLSDRYAAASHVGSRDGHPLATTALDGMMAAGDKSKLDQLVVGGRFRAYATANQGPIASATFTKVNFPTEHYDAGGRYDAALSRWTPLAGKCYIAAGVQMNANSQGSYLFIMLYRNGVRYADLFVGTSAASAATTFGGSGSTEFEANGTDYFEIFIWHSSTASNSVFGGDTTPARVWVSGSES